MRCLLDTHLLVWTAVTPERLSSKARQVIEQSDNELVFSAASIWEVAIKHAKGRPEFEVDPHKLRRRLLDNQYIELPITAEHAIAVVGLPPIHKDPFDRLLVAQAIAEGITLFTADRKLALYPAVVRKV